MLTNLTKPTAISIRNALSEGAIGITEIAHEGVI